jgi:hypothetical protein
MPSLEDWYNALYDIVNGMPAYYDDNKLIDRIIGLREDTSSKTPLEKFSTVMEEYLNKIHRVSDEDSDEAIEKNRKETILLQKWYPKNPTLKRLYEHILGIQPNDKVREVLMLVAQYNYCFETTTNGDPVTIQNTFRNSIMVDDEPFGMLLRWADNDEQKRKNLINTCKRVNDYFGIERSIIAAKKTYDTYLPKPTGGRRRRSRRRRVSKRSRSRRTRR